MIILPRNKKEFIKRVKVKINNGKIETSIEKLIFYLY